MNENEMNEQTIIVDSTFLMLAKISCYHFFVLEFEYNEHVGTGEKYSL